MFTEKDVYVAYKRASGKPFRMPKDFGTYFASKMSEVNQQYITKTSQYFNTIYSNIDLDCYMSCGFELYKGFSYHQFLDKRVINLYIQKDKEKKKKVESTANEIEDTFHYLKTLDVPVREGYDKFSSYCKMRDGEVKKIIQDYVKGKVDIMTVVYAVKNRHIVLTDDDRMLIPDVTKNYRDLTWNLNDVERFIHREIERMI